MKNNSAVARCLTIGERFIVSSKRLVEPPKRLQGYSLVVESLRITIVVLRREVISFERLFETPEPLEDITSAICRPNLLISFI